MRKYHSYFFCSPKVSLEHGIAKSGAEVLNPTFVHFMYLCARLNICAFKTPPSAIPITFDEMKKKPRSSIKRKEVIKK